MLCPGTRFGPLFFLQANLLGCNENNGRYCMASCTSLYKQNCVSLPSYYTSDHKDPLITVEAKYTTTVLPCNNGLVPEYSLYHEVR